ncbi:22957_t:CDS:1, partial [Rhizophagus irregularis]
QELTSPLEEYEIPGISYLITDYNNGNKERLSFPRLCLLFIVKIPKG